MDSALKASTSMSSVKSKSRGVMVYKLDLQTIVVSLILTGFLVIMAWCHN